MKTRICAGIFLVVASAGLVMAQTLPGRKVTRKAASLQKEGYYTDPRDGQTYKFKTIGKQVWMLQDLNYDAGDGCRIYDNDPSLAARYGRLYTWETALKAVPPGWHLSTDAEWQQLIDYLGGIRMAGSKLKEAGTEHWRSPNTGATNESDFSALPGGSLLNGFFEYLGRVAFFWSSTEANSYNAWGRTLNHDYSGINRNYFYKYSGLSVRCVRDN